MLEAEHSVLVNVGIGAVWHYVKDMQRWAALMPGFEDCTVIDANDSRWTLKVGVGRLVRTVKVLVHVDEWREPACVNFSFRLEGNPVEGRGSYTGSQKGAAQTEVAFRVTIAGSGLMAPIWEAMSRPLLPEFTKSFAVKLKAEIESAPAVSESPGVASVSKEF
jgi:carbon monoxide dehydrogenase subunit G